jgi:hypothetical protein
MSTADSSDCYAHGLSQEQIRDLFFRYTDAAEAFSKSEAFEMGSADQKKAFTEEVQLYTLESIQDAIDVDLTEHAIAKYKAGRF